MADVAQDTPAAEEDWLKPASGLQTPRAAGLQPHLASSHEAGMTSWGPCVIYGHHYHVFK